MECKLIIEITKLHKDARMPIYATEGSSCVDLYTVEPVTLLSRCQNFVRTGIAVAIPRGYMGQISPRSGLAKRYGVIIINSPGIIDSDYRDEIFILMSTINNIPVSFDRWERIAQMAILPCKQVQFQLADRLDITGRSGGFGSTGMR
jgi:dUTP pyrophosphatase